MPRLHALSIRFASSDSYALEQKLALSIHGWDRPLMIHNQQQCPVLKPLFRPSIEPILRSYWPLFEKWRLADITLRSLAAALVGTPTSQRTGAIWLTANQEGTVVIFPPGEQLLHWSDRLRSAVHLDVHPIMAAAYAWAEVVLSHPYTDGNGRFGRAMFQAVLACRTGLQEPVIPLGPILHSNLCGTSGALTALSQTQDWSNFADQINQVVHRTIERLEHIQ